MATIRQKRIATWAKMTRYLIDEDASQEKTDDIKNKCKDRLWLDAAENGYAIGEPYWTKTLSTRSIDAIINMSVVGIKVGKVKAMKMYKEGKLLPEQLISGKEYSMVDLLN